MYSQITKNYAPYICDTETCLYSNLFTRTDQRKWSLFDNLRVMMRSGLKSTKSPRLGSFFSIDPFSIFFDSADRHLMNKYM